MPFTTVAYSESQDSAVLVNVAALADQHVRVSGDDIVIPAAWSNLIGAYAVGADITRAALISPSIRRMFNHEISPLDRTAEPSLPLPISFHPDSPIALEAEENLNAQVAEDNVAAGRNTIMVWLADGPVAPVSGEIFSLRATAAVTLTAFAWTNGALTLDQTLSPGVYAIVGAIARSTGLIGFRFVPVGGGPRPGGVGGDAVIDLGAPMQRRGGWGEWVRFQHNTPPSVDFLSVSADTSETLELDLMKVA